MTDSKKRIEKILREFFIHLEAIDDYGCKGCKKFEDKILKEFVHKDNLPNVDEIMEKVDYHIFARNSVEARAKKRLAKSIRKLIERKK